MIQFEITTNAKAVAKRLKKVRRIGVNKAWKATMDDGAEMLARELRRQWARDMTVRKANTLGTKGQGALRVSKSYINFDTDLLTRPANVHNIFADEMLSDQITGGTRTPTGKAKRLLVPPDDRRGKKLRKGTKTYRKGKAVYQYKKRGEDNLLGVLTPNAAIPRRFSVQGPLRKVYNRLPRLAAHHLRRELRRALAKGYG